MRNTNVIMWLLGSALGMLAASACDTGPDPTPVTTTDSAGPDTGSDSAGATESGDPTTGGDSSGDAPGFVCPDVGRACDPLANDCPHWLNCAATNDPPPAPSHVCADICVIGEYEIPDFCRLGSCDSAVPDVFGICRDPDGLPTGVCEGFPTCAGDPCTVQCGNGLSCLMGACVFACITAADCEAGEACIGGACFHDGGLANPCNF